MTAQTPRSRTYSAPALEKGIDILELLATEPSGLTISEIANRLGRSISEVFRIIVVMEARHWLRKLDGSDRYAVTYRVLDVAFRATPAHALAQVAAPAMHDLALSTNQSCHLVVRGEGHGIVVHREESPGAVGFGMRLGAQVDLLTSCSGHVLLAFAAPATRDALLDRVEEHAMPAMDALRQRLEVVRVQGYEMQPSARTAGVTDVSYPVLGAQGHAVAALTIPFLVRIDGSQVATLEATRLLLRDAALRISSGLGWAPA